MLRPTVHFWRWGLLGLLVTPGLALGRLALGYPLRLWPCPLKALTGIPCPTWGMTRAMGAIATGDWSTALQFHLLAPALLLAWLITLSWLVWSIWTQPPYFCPPWVSHRLTGASLLVTVLTYHIWRLHRLWSAGILQTDFTHSPFGHLIFGS